MLRLAYLEIKRGQEEGTRTGSRARLLLRDREKTNSSLKTQCLSLEAAIAVEKPLGLVMHPL